MYFSSYFSLNFITEFNYILIKVNEDPRGPFSNNYNNIGVLFCLINHQRETTPCDDCLMF